MIIFLTGSAILPTVPTVPTENGITCRKDTWFDSDNRVIPPPYSEETERSALRTIQLIRPQPRNNEVRDTDYYCVSLLLGVFAASAVVVAWIYIARACTHNYENQRAISLVCSLVTAPCAGIFTKMAIHDRFFKVKPSQENEMIDRVDFAPV